GSASAPFIAVMILCANCGYFAFVKRAADGVLETMSADASSAKRSYRWLIVLHAAPFELGGAISSLVHGSRKSVIRGSPVSAAMRRAASCAMCGGPELMTHSYFVVCASAMPYLAARAAQRRHWR